MLLKEPLSLFLCAPLYFKMTFFFNIYNKVAGKFCGYCRQMFKYLFVVVFGLMGLDCELRN